MMVMNTAPANFANPACEVSGKYFANYADSGGICDVCGALTFINDFLSTKSSCSSKTAPANPAYSAGFCEVCGVFTANSAGLISDVAHEYCSRKLRKSRVQSLR